MNQMRRFLMDKIREDKNIQDNISYLRVQVHWRSVKSNIVKIVTRLDG